MNATKPKKEINNNWQRWLGENLARQVPIQTLLDVMVEQGFNSVSIQNLIEKLQKEPLAIKDGGLMQADQLTGDWQQWIVRNIERGVLEQTLIDAASREIRAAWTQRSAGLRRRSEAQGYNYETAPKPVTNDIQIGDRKISVIMNLERPRIVLYENVLSAEECEALIEMSRPSLTPSRTHDRASAQLVVRDFRTSNGTYFDRSQTPLIEEIEGRLAQLADWPVENGEGLQVLQYGEGGEYRPHYDFFPPEIPSSQFTIGVGGQRVATMIVYLNTVKEGGKTTFPKLNLEIQPIQGCVLYFSYTNSKNELDRMNLHSGAPLKRGEKWIATKWIRQASSH